MGKRSMASSDRRIWGLLLAAVLFGGSAIVGSSVAEEASIAGRAATKAGKPLAARNLLGRRTSPPVAIQRVQPNAIGVVIDRPRHESETRGTTPAARSPAAMVGGTSGVGLAKPGAPLENSSRPQFPTPPTVNLVVPSRPAISGVGAAHLRSGPAAIGGPAKAVGGISGTTIRAKR